MKIITKSLRVDVCSHDIDDDTLKVLGSAVGVALSMVTRSHHLPFMVLNDYDRMDGHNLSVIVKVDSTLVESLSHTSGEIRS